MTYCIYCEREPKKYEYFLNRVCLQCYKISAEKTRACGVTESNLAWWFHKWWKAAKREESNTQHVDIGKLRGIRYPSVTLFSLEDDMIREGATALNEDYLKEKKERYSR